MTMSRLKCWRNSVAMRLTWTTASGSSPFTCRIGAWTILAISVQYGPERDWVGRVVKPIWLLTTKWMVPPMR